MIIAVFYRYLSSSKKGLKNSGLNGDSKPGLYDAGAVLRQLSYEANWEEVVMWVDYKPVDVEIDNHNTGIFHVFELRIGISQFKFLSLLKQQRERPEKFRPERRFELQKIQQRFRFS